jgi:hypothetical protein
MTAAARTSAIFAAPELRATIGPTLRRSTERGFAVLGKTNLVDFLQDAPELWRRREAHGSLRIQEGEPPSFDRSAAGFCGLSGARSIRGSARLADVERSDCIADVHLVDVDQASVFDHSTHFGTGFVGKPTAPQVFCRSAYKSRVIPKHLGRELLSRSHILRKLLKGSITKDKVNVSRRSGERMLLKLIVFHLISKPSIWFLAKDRETRSHYRARTVLARPINEQNGVRLFEKAIYIVHSLRSLQRGSHSPDLLNRRAEQKLRSIPEHRECT